MDAAEGTRTRRVIIAGGGYAGVTLAVRLAKRMRPTDNLEICLVEPNPCQQSLSELDLVAVGPAQPEFCELWLPSLFEKLRVSVRYDRVHGVVPDEHYITLGPRSGPHERMDYWRLVLATGAVAFVPPVAGLREHAVTMWSVADARELQRRLDTQLRAAVRLRDHEERVRALSVAVIGGGATGIEIVGTLGQVLPARAQSLGIDPRDMRIRVIEGRPDILYDLPEEQRGRAKQRLKSLCVGLITGSMVERVDDHGVYLVDGTRVDASVVVFCGGAKPDPDAVSWGMATDSSGRLAVDQMCKTAYPDIYAIGDVAAFRNRETNKVLPMLAQFAIREGQLTGENILHEARDEDIGEFVPHMHGEFVSVGPSWGCGWMGRLSLYGLPAILMKRFTYIMYWWYAGGVRLVMRRGKELLIMHRHFGKVEACPPASENS